MLCKTKIVVATILCKKVKIQRPLALNGTCVIILHRFLTNRRNLVNISVLTLQPPFIPNFSGARGYPHLSKLGFPKG